MATSGKGAPKKADADSDAKPKKSKLILIILILVAVLGAGGAAAWYFLVFKAAPADHETPKVEAAKPPVFLAIDTFTVNLQAGEESERFLQTGMTLQVAGQEQVDMIKLYMPHVRSRMLLLLSSKTASEILTAEGKNKLSQEIIDTLNQPLSPGGPSIKVMSVLFTSFVVQ